MNVDYVNETHVELQNVVFNLPPNGFREGAAFPAVSAGERNACYPNGESFGSIVITGCNLEYTVGGEDENRLSVKLAFPLSPNARCEIRLDFEVTLANVIHRLGYYDSAVNLGNWYPILAVYEDGDFKSYPYYSFGDPFYSSVANYRVTLSIPSAYTAAASGEKLSERKSGKKTVYEYELQSARDFAIVCNRDFKCIEKKVGESTLLYYYTSDIAMNASFETAEKALTAFSKHIGEYPYETFSVVQTAFSQGGMEYPGLIYISDKLTGDVYRNVIVHETAHQWWYAVVGNNQVTDAYLDEGLTELTTAMYYDMVGDKTRSFEQTEKNQLAQLRAYRALTSGMSIQADTRMNRSLGEFKNSLEYVASVYNKGFIMFADLRKMMGIENFNAVLKEYYNSAAFRIADLSTFCAAAERMTGVDYTGLIEGYLNDTAYIA